MKTANTYAILFGQIIVILASIFLSLVLNEDCKQRAQSSKFELRKLQLEENTLAKTDITISDLDLVEEDLEIRIKQDLGMQLSTLEPIETIILPIVTEDPKSYKLQTESKFNQFAQLMIKPSPSFSSLDNQ